MTPQFAFDYGIGWAKYRNRPQALAFARGMAYARRRPNLRYRAMDEEPGGINDPTEEDAHWITVNHARVLVVNGKIRYPSKEINQAYLEEAIASLGPEMSKKMARAEHKNRTSKEFYGPELKSYGGIDAINILLKNKCGHVVAAWTRKDIGDIYICWGDEAAGLKHILCERRRHQQDVYEVLTAMDRLIRNEDIKPIRDAGTSIVLKDDKHRVVLGYPKGTTNYAVITSYEEFKPKEPSA